MGISIFNNDMTERILQNVFEDPYDESGGGEDYDVGVGAELLFIVVPFFLCWNCFLASHISLGLSFLMRGQCHQSLVILICPHWLVGILIPAFVGYQWNGAYGSCLALLFTVVLPYSYFFINHARNNEELRDHPLCWCCLTMNTSRPATLPETLGPPLDENEAISGSKVEEGEESKDRPLLISKKVLPTEAVDEISKKRNSKDEDINHSFRFNNPKSDIYARSSNKKKSPDFTSSTEEFSSASVQLCTICLEEYQVGEDIAWSRNPSCHHVYHKNCVLELLEDHDECPTCRQSYYVFSDIELAEY
jgi:hypothetical protein